MSYETLRYDVADGVLTLTLNRPDQLNAFTVTMANELVHAFDTASADDAVAAIIVTGAGRAFCAGMDLSMEGNVFGLDEDRVPPTLADMATPDNMDGVRDTGGKVTLAIYRCKKPVIAAINGAAVGIGATMTCAMDIRLASDKAKIGFVFAKLGIVPEACSTWFLPRIVGVSQALEWCYSGEIFNATDAERARFVRSVHSPETLLEAAMTIARRIAEQNSQVSMALLRQMMYRNSAQPHPMAAHQVDSLAMYYTSIGAGKEGVAAFLEKRPADFTDSAATDMPNFYTDWMGDEA
ncbi:MAG: crotonase/enoyl-CoA hydratase family protein [Spongiibacteraceae bacterium]